MKKILSFIICLAVIMVVLPLHGFAAADSINVPEFVWPTKSYPTFAETGIPYDELKSLLPETLEVRYEDGFLYVKDLGGDKAYYTDYLNYDGHNGELVDGYWEFEVSSEAYNSGGSISMHTDSHTWHASYDVSGKRKIVSFTTHFGNYSRNVVLYPTEGYGEQYVQVDYDLLSGIRVSDTYSEGFLNGQTVEIHDNVCAFWAKYDPQGNIKYINVSRYDTGEDASFIPSKGWSKHSWEYVPVDAPTGFENATLESLLAMGPTDIGCAHQWSDLLCDVPSICALCKREKGVPFGHSWVSGNAYDTCSTCNGILYRLPKTDMPSFEGRPYVSLDEAGIDSNLITSGFLQEISTKYENGVFMIPNIDGYYFDIRLPSKGFLRSNTTKGWNLTEVAEEDLEKLDIRFSKIIDRDENYIQYNLRYNSDGQLVSIELFDSEVENNILIMCEKNTVELSYLKEKDGTIEYTDVYENGSLRSQYIYDIEKDIRVYYNSDLNVEKVTLYATGAHLTFIPGEGWTLNGDTVPTPEGYADKDETYFASAYPHSIDFCIHSFEMSEDGNVKTCVKCGETVNLKAETDYDIVVIVIASVGAVLAVAVVAVIVVVAKKKKKLNAN